MATFLDVSVLSHFSSIFTFLLIFVIVFGMLEVFKVFGSERRSLNAMIALCVGFIVLFSTNVVTVIQTFTPWFTLLIIIIFLMMFAARMFGLSESDVRAGFYNQPFMTWIIILSVVILLFSLGAGLGQQSLEAGQGKNLTGPVATLNGTTASPGSTATTSFSQNLYNTLYNPKILGFILVMLIAVIAALLLTVDHGP